MARRTSSSTLPPATPRASQRAISTKSGSSSRRTRSAARIFPEALTSEAELERAAREIRGPLHFNRTGVSPRLTLARLNELGIAIVSNATGSLRCSTVAMCDYFEEFARDDVEAVKRFEARVKDHPAGNIHAFIGFSEIKRLEEQYLPSAEVIAKYEGAVGFQP